MKCYYHPNEDAIDTCENCGKAICQIDAVEVGEKLVCHQCASIRQNAPKAAAASENSTNSLAMISIAMGVMGLVGCFCCGISGSVFGIPAAITGFIARKQILESQGEQQGLQVATIGIVMGVLEFILGIIYFFVLLILYATGAWFFMKFDDVLAYGPIAEFCMLLVHGSS